MTAADLTPLQLYGVIMLAFATLIGALLIAREARRMGGEDDPGRHIVFAGAAALVLLPALSGALTLFDRDHDNAVAQQSQPTVHPGPDASIDDLLDYYLD